MKSLLSDLNALPGVVGSMFSDKEGRLLAHAFPPDLNENALQEAAAALAECSDGIREATGNVGLVDFRFQDLRLIARPLQAGMLLIVCAKTANMQMLLASASAACKRFERMMASPDLLTGNTPGAGLSIQYNTSSGAPIDLDLRSGSFASPSQKKPEPPVVTEEEETVVARRNPSEQPASSPAQGKSGTIAMGVVALLIVSGLGYFMVKGQKKTNDSQSSTVASVTASSGPVVQAANQAKPVMKIAGSSAPGSPLIVALASAYLTSVIKATDVQPVTIKPDLISVQGKKDGSGIGIEISSFGATLGFEGLLAGSADLAVSSRRIRAEEKQKLAPLGLMTSQANEHVLALGGIAVVVNQANPIQKLKREQLAEIFSGGVTDWSSLGLSADEEVEWSAVGMNGKGGPLASGVHVYIPDDSSGVADVFQAAVLRRKQFGAEAKKYSTLEGLKDAVIRDPGGIAFMPFTRLTGIKIVPVSDAEDQSMIPTPFTIATEEYFLSHRLYLYNAQSPSNPHVSRFIDFALSQDGQAIVKSSGFVELVVKAEQRAMPTSAPSEYVRLTTGARRLSNTFRFEIGASAFDNKALRDLDRVVEYLNEKGISGDSVRILGFADSQGGKTMNLDLSRERAAQVAGSLAQRGIVGATTIGLGSALPVADNGTEEGRQRNRRVEIWVAK